MFWSFLEHEAKLSPKWQSFLSYQFPLRVVPLTRVPRFEMASAAGEHKVEAHRRVKSIADVELKDEVHRRVKSFTSSQYFEVNGFPTLLDASHEVEREIQCLRGSVSKKSFYEWVLPPFILDK